MGNCAYQRMIARQGTCTGARNADTCEAPCDRIAAMQHDLRAMRLRFSDGGSERRAMVMSVGEDKGRRSPPPFRFHPMQYLVFSMAS
jgi:hypothetical protein